MQRSRCRVGLERGGRGGLESAHRAGWCWSPGRGRDQQVAARPPPRIPALSFPSGSRRPPAWVLDSRRCSPQKGTRAPWKTAGSRAETQQERDLLCPLGDGAPGTKWPRQKGSGAARRGLNWSNLGILGHQGRSLHTAAHEVGQEPPRPHQHEHRI